MMLFKLCDTKLQTHLDVINRVVIQLCFHIIIYKKGYCSTMYYVVVVLVLLVELHFVDLRTVLRGNLVALDLGEIPVPHLVERTRHERHRRSATVNLDIHQILPINFNLHA